MIKDSEIENIWHASKHIFLPYEGAVSTLHMLEIPNEYRFDITNSFLVTVTLSGLSCMGEEESKSWKTFNLDAQTVFAKGDKKFNWVFEGVLESDRSLRMFLDYYNKETFEIELVFWADEFFPNPDNEEKCLASFTDLISVASSFRKISTSSEFVFNAYPVADPREHRDESATFFW